jgi:dTDP-4-amino-4,6-dideoxygalactose transaminase
MTPVRFFDGRGSFAAQWNDIARQVNRVFDHGKFSHGILTAELEEAIRDYTGARFAIGMNSGTDALTLTLRAIGAGTGAEVVVPALASASCASAVCRVGATPVFADVATGSYTVAPDAVRRRLTGRTRAIMPVHLFGRMADMATLRTIAREAGAVLVEDSRQAIGMRYADTHAGLLGTAGALSFAPDKPLCALGDAGMVITGDETVADRCALLRHHGRTDGDRRVSSPAAIVGINSKMDELQAAVLLARLPWLGGAIARRGELAARYTGHLAEITHVTTPADQVWHAYVIEARRRDALADYLSLAGIETRVPYPVPLHLQPAFRHLDGRGGDHPVAEAAAGRMLALPLHPDLSLRDVEHTCRAIERFYRGSPA